MISIMTLVGALSTPPGGRDLAAQAAWGFGLAATVGDGWQIEAVDVGYVRRIAAGPLRYYSAAGRFGSFVDEGAIIKGQRGFVAAVALAARTGRAAIAELGDENDLTVIGVDLTVEGTGYLATRSPLPQGSSWAALSFLPGLRFGRHDGAQYGFVLGPTVFLGRTPDVRAFLGIRFEAPLARRESRP